MTSYPNRTLCEFRVGVPPLLDGLLPLELHGSNVSVWFGYLASGVRTRGRLRLLA